MGATNDDVMRGDGGKTGEGGKAGDGKIGEVSLEVVEEEVG